MKTTCSYYNHPIATVTFHGADRDGVTVTTTKVGGNKQWSKLRFAATILMVMVGTIITTLPAIAAPSTPTGTSPGSATSPGPSTASTTVTISWNASGGATYYDVGIRDMATGTLVVDTQTSSTSYTASLSPGKTYRWNVAAGNTTGLSAYTTPLYFKTPAAIPSTPTGTSPGSATSPGPSTASTTVTISWNASGGATYYDVGIRDMATGTLVVDTQTSSTSYTASLSPGKTYRWNVAAGNPTGLSGYTTALYFQTPAPVPSTPTGTSPGSTTSPGPTTASTTVTISWNVSGGATYYDVGIRDMATGTLVVDTQTSGTSYIASLSPGKTYRWNVAAGNPTGLSGYTTALYFQTPAPVPSTPTGTSPGSTTSPGPTTASTTVTISWNASGGATYYDVGIRDMATGTLVVDTQTSGTSYIASLSPGKTYRWNVAAGNTSGLSAYTTSLYFQTPGAVPPTPTGTSPGSTTSPGPTTASTTVTISWNVSGGATYYDVGIRDMATGTLVVDTQTSGTSYIASLSPGKTYRWNVAAGNPTGLSAFTTPLYFQTPGAGGGFSVPIVQDIIPAGRNNRPGYPLTAGYVTIHNTDNTASGANAVMHANYVKNPDTSVGMPNNPDQPKSWHFTVDDHEARQHLPITENGWHAGDGLNGTGNRQSIGIEICMNSDGSIAQAEENAAWLTAKLLVENGLGIDRVKQHYDWSGKNCPSVLRGRVGGWDGFLTRVAYFMNQTPSAAPVLSNPRMTGTSFKVSTPTQDGLYYILERRISLSSGLWIPVSTNQGNGMVMELTDPNATAPSAAYRVRASNQ